MKKINGLERAHVGFHILDQIAVIRIGFYRGLKKRAAPEKAAL